MSSSASSVRDDAPEREAAPAEHRGLGTLLNSALPWAISLVFHVLVFVLMFLVVWVVQANRAVEQLPISDARLSDYFDEPMSRGTQNPDLEVAQEAVAAVSRSSTEQRIDLLDEVTPQPRTDLSIIGIGAGSGGGELAKYGLSAVSLGEGPSFFGLGRGETRARKICYIVDRSGSMVDEFDYVKEEVARSISRLHRVQQFHVIFFSGGLPLEAPPRKFVHAIHEYKKAAFEFIEAVEASGSTDPIPAVGRAIQLGSDLIYFLTDGEFSPDLITRLRDWNRDHSVRVYTIAFVRRNGEDLLRQIAQENGGEFRFVSEADLY